MKTTSFIKATISLVVAVIMQSCTTHFYYQVYDVQSEGLDSSDDMVLYSNKDCKIIYDFWSEAGDMSFFFMNNTDKDIYIDLSRSFIIRNGIAYDYFSDAEYTSSATSMAGASASLAKSYTQFGYEFPMWTPTVVARGAQFTATGAVAKSVTTKEPKFICVPSNSAKRVVSFNVSDYVYLDCGNKKLNNPKRASKRIEYTKEKSPLVFSNRIVYYVGDFEDGVSIDNSFWVSGFTNHSHKDFFIKEHKVDCLNKSFNSIIKIDKYKSAKKFYNKYQAPGNAPMLY